MAASKQVIGKAAVGGKANLKQTGQTAPIRPLKGTEVFNHGRQSKSTPGEASENPYDKSADRMESSSNGDLEVRMVNAKHN